MEILAIPATPKMPAKAISRLEMALAKSEIYLEYGSGGSTALALRSGIKALICVESDKNWLAELEANVPRDDETTCLFLHADIGPTKEWGHPVNDAHWPRFHTYPLIAWQKAKEAGLSPDLILIDGRFRRACFYASLLFAKAGATILFDDYSDRAFYHSVEQFALPTAMHDRMAEFVVPDGSDRDALWLALISASAEAH